MEIIQKIIQDEKYKGICKKVSNYSYLWEDLLQEFRLIIIGPNKKESLEQAKKENYLEIYCYGIIKNLWLKRNRVKTTKTGQTNPLYQITDNLYDWKDYKNEINTTQRDHEDFGKQAMNELSKLLNSENRKTRRQAHLLKAMINGSNIKRVSIEKNINYRIAYEGIKETANKIKLKLK